MRILHAAVSMLFLAVAILAIIGCADCLADGMISNAIFDGVSALACLAFGLAMRNEALKPCTGPKLLDEKEKP